ncbi:DUF397 domain-containing protein [Actinomadura opuntiae]|uniref:DUF397 domain-containing protein n=1 Tax=Actinomadura sp. OS1-43 TaxID=604315 RepID=UPI00255AA7EC|nr:DUF397 domain-containing protein [Actinomadura sp. OS1-43]MDL4820612.1 DUF397 domain-containing protein [Actinomadura sp. OS1-43]
MSGHFPERARWRKSSYSTQDPAECVEAGRLARDVVTRDSKDPSGPVLAFEPREWAAFLSEIKGGAYDS